METSGGYSGFSGPQNVPGDKIKQTQDQVDENIEHCWTEHEQNKKNMLEVVVGIMRNNVNRVLERDEKLSELDQRADNLQIGASQFEQQASRLKRKYWWKNLKMMIIIGVICTVLLIIILVSIFSGGSDDSNSAVTDAHSSGTPGSSP